MSVQEDREKQDTAVKKVAKTRRMSRRALLKRSAISMPAVLTLQSGSALARSSNVITASSPDTSDRLGRTLCLDTNSVYPAGNSPGMYDLGDPPQAHVNILSDRKYYVFPDGTTKKSKKKKSKAVLMDRGTVCQSGGQYWYDAGHNDWREVNLPANGIVLSSGAVTSVASVITDDLI